MSLENIKVVAVDMGHSLSGPGTGASKIISEVTINRQIGNRLITMLKENDYTVVNCTVDSASSTESQLQGIVNKANSVATDLFISIHLNAGGGHGTEAYIYNGFYNGKEANKSKAKVINDLVAESCNFRNRGLKEANLYVLKQTVAPALLLEVCFVDSQEDVNKLNVEKVAKAIFKGITGKDYSGSNSVPSKPSNSEDNVKDKIATTTDVLNVRNGAGTNYKKIGELKKGEKVKLFKKVGAWYEIYYGNNGGYVHGDYIRIGSNNTSSGDSVRDKYGVVNTDVLNVRHEANGRIIGQLRKGDRVKMWRIEGEWIHIYSPVDGYNQAYVHKDYINR